MKAINRFSMDVYSGFKQYNYICTNCKSYIGFHGVKEDKPGINSSRDRLTVPGIGLL